MLTTVANGVYEIDEPNNLHDLLLTGACPEVQRIKDALSKRFQMTDLVSAPAISWTSKRQSRSHLHKPNMWP